MVYSWKTNKMTNPKISQNGDKCWLNSQGKYHRDDGPAYIASHGDQWWFQNGELHRENGPAIDWKRLKEWYKNGLLHREDGPASELYDGTKSWWINGKRIT
jgi:hypothetical protein